MIFKEKILEQINQLIISEVENRRLEKYGTIFTAKSGYPYVKRENKRLYLEAIALASNEFETWVDQKVIIDFISSLFKKSEKQVISAIQRKRRRRRNRK